jgi:hypothetical protein
MTLAKATHESVDAFDPIVQDNDVYLEREEEKQLRAVNRARQSAVLRATDDEDPAWAKDNYSRVWNDNAEKPIPNISSLE